MKNVLKIIIIFLCLAICIPIVYAKTSQTVPIEETSFFEIDTNQAQVGDTIIMTIDFSKIETTKFECILSSNVQLNEVNSENQELEIDSNNQISFVVDKEQTNLEKIELSYIVPNEISVGTQITFKAEIKDLSNVTEDTNEVLQQVEAKLEIIEDIKQDDKQDGLNGNTNNQIGELTNMNSESSNKAPSTTQTTKSSQTSGTSSMSSTTQTVTYNGSYDNYLNNLEVQGYEITPEFSKTNQTYFLTVENDVEEIQIDYDCSDSTAKVSVYGNTSLKEGENKVLLNVTAENGSVRTYRIYVTRQS